MEHNYMKQLVNIIHTHRLHIAAQK